MLTLTDLLNSIRTCNACKLMSENNKAHIPYVPILPKPEARFMFIGRDPSPRTASVVGIPEGKKSVFINEIFKMADKAEVSRDSIYITDLCKCHWRTSVGRPWPGTELRPPKLDTEVAGICLNKWLKREIEILHPQLIVAFGEELYQIFRPFIVNPQFPPKKLSEKADKSTLDAEYWFVENGPFTLTLNGKVLKFGFLRHAGNSRRLPKSTDVDKRLQYYEASFDQVVHLLRENSFGL